jgi:hypothetical protein
MASGGKIPKRACVLPPDGCPMARKGATTCRANPTMFAPIAASHNGCRTRSTTIRGDSARRLSTRFVLRWSSTDEMPRTSAEATAVTTAKGVDNGYPPGQPGTATRGTRLP